MRLVRRTLGYLLLIPALLLFALVVTAPGTWSGTAYALALVALVLGAASSSAVWSRRMALAGTALLAATAVVRIAGAATGRDLSMPTPRSDSARWLDRVVDEQDLAVNAARVIRWTDFLPDPDAARLPAAMSAAYREMRRSEGDTPSPVLATYAGLNRAGAEDTIIVGDVAGGEGVLVFLHGWAGNFTLPCWELSRAAARADLATVCPSTRWVGDWWSADGERIVRATVDELRRRGARHVVLAGLSNGAIGASRLAPRMHGVFDGLLLLSGAASDASAPGVPVLVIQGRDDRQIPAAVSRAYARRVGGQYVELNAGHFALLIAEEPALGAVSRWLASLDSTHRTPPIAAGPGHR